MNCNEFKQEMNNFIYNTIDDDKIEDFIKHYKECKDCNEELEIYYMINKTFNDDGADGDTVSVANSFDFKKRLNQKIAYYEELIYSRYKANFFMRLLICGTELISVGMAAYFIIAVLGGHNGW